ncbi:glycoside hydrolase family 5 protein [Rhizomicrobium electricum]|uniref:Glycoside hydrolase family 5 protein n=1 Tax=Rhizomicrobium electricum TaxID=480070 RepID=A0ABN1EAI3_9PROT|nr:glycoside hydrolase family 5 protein [Rhizomicrobium electricum]NIJ48077.1 aryl-phospho-beta-D-glucosidase BglC (GH1 family) [Rhizomicrobium electricum]
MKTYLAAVAAAVMLTSVACGETAAKAPGPMREISSVEMAKEMSPGWNLGNSLEALPGETSWGNPPANQDLFNAVKAAGFKSVRIPVSWAAHADSDDIISRSWMARITEVVDEARKAGLYVVLNEHWDGGWLQPTAAKQADGNARLAKLWKQIAENFKDYDDHLLFAGTNEVMVAGNYAPPSAENVAAQNSFNQTFVNTVRASGGNNAKRVLVVQGYNTNIDITIASTTIPPDTIANRLMMEVHCYDPYNFTLNDKSRIWQWGALATDPAATETWANEAYIDGQFEKMKTHFIDKGVGVILGEYSAVMKAEYQGHERQRVYWDAYLTKSAFKHGLVPMYWDAGSTANHGSGLFNRATGAQPYPYLVEAIVKMAQ